MNAGCIFRYPQSFIIEALKFKSQSKAHIKTDFTKLKCNFSKSMW